jgi:hypothetical protein
MSTAKTRADRRRRNDKKIQRQEGRSVKGGAYKESIHKESRFHFILALSLRSFLMAVLLIPFGSVRLVHRRVNGLKPNVSSRY